MIEGIASYSASAARADTARQTNVAVAKKALDQQKLAGQAAVKLIDAGGQAAAAPPTGNHTGKNLNVYA